jgi:hypothetical protein
MQTRHLENQGIAGTVMSRWILKKTECEGVELINLTSESLQWRAFVDIMLKFSVPWDQGNLLTIWATKSL